MLNNQVQCIKEKLQKLNINFETDFQPVLSFSALKAFEQRYQITLPSEYVAFLTQIGNGGFGPYLEDIGLRQLEDTVWEGLVPNAPFPYIKANKIEYIPEQTEEELKKSIAFYDSSQNRNGHLVISEFGCGIFAILIVKGDAYGQVWMDQRESEWGGFYPSDPSNDSVLEVANPPLHFLDWYEKWLDSKLANL